MCHRFVLCSGIPTGISGRLFQSPNFFRSSRSMARSFFEPRRVGLIEGKSFPCQTHASFSTEQLLVDEVLLLRLPQPSGTLAVFLLGIDDSKSEKNLRDQTRLPEGREAR